MPWAGPGPADLCIQMLPGEDMGADLDAGDQGLEGMGIPDDTVRGNSCDWSIFQNTEPNG